MKDYIHRIAKYTALVLVSSLPFSLETVADSEKEQSAVATLSSADKHSSVTKRKVVEDE